MSENYAFLSPYFFNERGALPLFKFTSLAKRGIYHILREDALKLLAKAELLQHEDFLKTND